MSLARTRPNEVRPPEATRLPDERWQLTRFFELASGINMADALVDPWATLDVGASAGEFSSLRLVNQGVFFNEKTKQPEYRKIYETMPASGELQIGGNTTKLLEDGRTAVVADFWQWSTEDFVPGVVGTDTAPGDTGAFLMTVEAPDDGTRRHITRTYVHSGIVATDDQSLQGGMLLKKTITSVITVPSTPGGYTLVGSPVQNPLGLPTYTYTYYKGLGTVDLGKQLKNGGKLVLYHIVGLGVAPSAPSATIGGTVTSTSTDVKQADGYTIYDYTWAEGEGEISRGYDGTLNGMEGFDPANLTADYIGIVTETVKYLTAQTVTTNPVTSALASPALISAVPELQDGYKLWTVIYALGKGTIDLGVKKSEGGKLVMYHRIGLNLAPTTPSATIGGTVTLTDSTVKSGTRFENGSTVYDYLWVEANGEVSQTFSVSQNGVAIFDPASPEISQGAVICTTRFLTALSVTTDPTSSPSGDFVRCDVDFQLEDGYKAWTVIYAFGSGLVVDTGKVSNGGKLVIYRRVQLGGEPAEPTPTIGGTVTQFDFSHRLEKGYDVYDYSYAEGQGIIEEDMVPRTDGLQEYHRTVLDNSELPIDPSTFDAAWSPAGGAVLFRLRQSYRDGYTFSEAAWMLAATGLRLGFGVVTATDVTVPGTGYTSNPTITFSPPPTGGVQATGTAVRSGTTLASITITNPGSGYTSAPTIAVTGGGGTGATATAVLDGSADNGPTPTEAWVHFTYPGRAKYFSDSVTAGGATYLVAEVYLGPPVGALVLGTTKITYQKSGTLGTLSPALWNPKDYATLTAKFVNGSGQARSIVKPLEGYTAMNSGGTGTDGGSSLLSVLGEQLFASSNYSIGLSGGPAAPDGVTPITLHAEVEKEPAFVGMDGTQYFRRIQITATPGAQANLPV